MGRRQPAVRVPVGRQHLTDHELDAGLAQAGAIDGAGGVPGGAGRQAASIADSREAGARGEFGISGVQVGGRERGLLS